MDSTLAVQATLKKKRVQTLPPPNRLDVPKKSRNFTSLWDVAADNFKFEEKSRMSHRSIFSPKLMTSEKTSFHSRQQEDSETSISDDLKEEFFRKKSHHGRRRNSRVNIIFSDARPKEVILSGLIHPDNRYRIWWDWLILIMLLWILVVLPINIAFSKSVFEMYGIELFVDICFLIDVLLQFVTSFRYVHGTHAGRVETSQREVVWAYLRSWFIVDFIASIPIDLFLQSKEAKLNHLLKILRSVKLMRILRISRIYTRFRFRFHFNKSITRVSRLVLLLLLEWHWIASFYWIVASHEGFQDDSKWLPDVHINDMPLGSQYLRAFFWAVNCTTGVGDDIVPNTNIEHFFTTVVIVFGVLTYASIVGSVATALQEMDTTESSRFRDLENIEDYLTQRNCSQRLKMDILKYYAYCHDRHVTVEDNMLLKGIHSTLKEELDLDINKSLLQTVPRFAALGEAILLMLVRSLRSKIYLPAEIVYLIGEQSTEMFFVVRGNLEEIDKHGIARIAHNDGSFFGDELFSAHGLRVGSVQSIKYSELLVMHHDDMFEAMRQYPVFAVKMATWNDRCAIPHLSGWSKLAYCLRLTCLVKRFGADLTFSKVVKITNGVIEEEEQNLVMQMSFQQYLVNYGIAEPLPERHCKGTKNLTIDRDFTHDLQRMHENASSSDESELPSKKFSSFNFFRDRINSITKGTPLERKSFGRKQQHGNQRFSSFFKEKRLLKKELPMISKRI